MAKVIDISSTDKTVIWAVREVLPQRFQATGWTDLRIGFLLSIVGEVDPTDDNDPTAVSVEEIGTSPTPGLTFVDRFSIGVTDSQTFGTFIGFTNVGHYRPGTNLSDGTTKLVTSDKGIGTTNANYWRPKNELSNNRTFQMVDSNMNVGVSGDGSQIHFAKANIGTTGPAGYATLLLIRLQRDNANQRNKIITASTKKDVANHTADVVFTSTPTAALLESYLIASFPSPATILGPVEMSAEPDCLYFYWPFHDSRLRCHAAGIYKAA